MHCVGRDTTSNCSDECADHMAPDVTDAFMIYQ